MHFSVLESPPESQTSLVLENTTRTRREGTRVTACRAENAGVRIRAAPQQGKLLAHRMIWVGIRG